MLREKLEKNDWVFSIVDSEDSFPSPAEGRTAQDDGFVVIIPASGVGKPHVIIKESTKVIKEDPLRILTQMLWSATTYKKDQDLKKFMVSTTKDFQSFMWDQYHVRF